ncbi:hypothetical protein FN846DRAFT_891246 [Sphaerosporella brunnea]|uniref:Uncharacterized protein n=1 Tax=Sphaerosporella brunnea TaxID=1250544 RepID=A0A5J5EUD3_9PEZI|nr:hypothetical protein FN846DRAFT_891237 [Sphaerosporella brunnea]KAA8903194.1 hypothetical protein FN846DRAFT_891246 [Sphaerosporella brunnea]
MAAQPTSLWAQNATAVMNVASSALSWSLSVVEAIATAMGFGRKPPASSTIAAALTAPSLTAIPASDCGIVFLDESTLPELQRRSAPYKNGMQYRRQLQYEAVLFLYTCV